MERDEGNYELTAGENHQVGEMGFADPAVSLFLLPEMQPPTTRAALMAHLLSQRRGDLCPLIQSKLWRFQRGTPPRSLWIASIEPAVHFSSPPVSSKITNLNWKKKWENLIYLVRSISKTWTQDCLALSLISSLEPSQLELCTSGHDSAFTIPSPFSSPPQIHTLWNDTRIHLNYLKEE